MDIAVTPALTSLAVSDDTQTLPLFALFWQNPTTLLIQWTGPQPTTRQIAHLLNVDPNLRTATGVVAEAPQAFDGLH